MSGCTKSIGGGLGVAGSSGQIDASSSCMNVDTDGEVFKDSGMSTLSSAGSVEIPKLFILVDFSCRFPWFRIKCAWEMLFLF